MNDIRKISRREFLIGGSAMAAAGGLGLFSLRAKAAEALVGLQTVGGKTVRYSDYADIWREKWKWDKVVKSSHSRADCQGNCIFNVYVRDGIAWREEQAPIYEQDHPGVPDYNPRGCQKGSCYTNLQLEESRNLYPLKRVGERGGGKWKRVSWDEALTDIADKMIDAAIAEGTESIIIDDGFSNVGFGPESVGEPRLRAAMHATTMDSAGGISDMANGTLQTWGLLAVEGTSGDWFLSDYIVIFHSNPVYTRIPDVHFMHEARYRGAKLVVIAPDLSPSTVHADLWLNVKAGADAALGLSCAQVMIEENLFRRDYVLEQTDLPFLVREDNKRFLRQRDMVGGNAENAFYLWDEATGQTVIAPGCEADGNDGSTLALGAIKPALSGRFEVTLADGSRVAVRTVYDHLREMLDRAYRPEQMQDITGLSPKLVRRFARELATARSAMISGSLGSCRSYHSDLGQRSMILLMALTGNNGRKGGGYRTVCWFVTEGLEKVMPHPDFTPEEKKRIGAAMRRGLLPRDYEALVTLASEKMPLVPLLPFLYVHGGYKEAWDKQDPTLPHKFGHYLREAIDKGWIPMHPMEGRSPKVYVVSGGNPLRRWPMPQIAKKHLWPKLDLVVTVDFRMSTTAMYSDYVLPAAAYYEKIGIHQGAYIPYIVTCDKAHEPHGESMAEWQIYGRLAKRISERAKARGIGPVRGFRDQPLDMTGVYDRYTDHGKYDPVGDPNDDMKLMDIICNSPQTVTVKSGREALDMGAVPMIGMGPPSLMHATYSELKKGEPFWPHRDFVEKKVAWPTITGRQQFYIDHPWFLEGGEALPVHKPLPYNSEKYPLRMGDGHNRWSIHSIQRNQKMLMRLERGQPVCFMNPRDCEARGIKDADIVRVFNDQGSYECMVKVAATSAPGDVTIYHAWEPTQFKNWKGSQETVESPLKGLHMAGGYGQLHYRVIYGGPNMSPHNTALQVEKVS